MERLGSKGDNTKLTLINGLVLIRTVGKTQKQNIFQFIHFVSTELGGARTPGAVKSLTASSLFFRQKVVVLQNINVSFGVKLICTAWEIYRIYFFLKYRSWMRFFSKINYDKKSVKFWFDDKEATDRLRGN